MATQEDLDWLYGRGRPTTGEAPQPSHPYSRDHVAPAAAESPRPASSIPPARPAVDSDPQVDARPPVERPLPSPPTPREASAGARRTPRHRGRYGVRRIIALIVVLVVAWAAFLVLTPMHWLGQVKRVDATPDGQRPAAHPGTAILITGSDSRENLTPQQAERLGVGGDEDAGRTDTMMLLYVPPTGKPALISLPRDSYVSIPDNGDSKLNAAYAWGGPKLLTATVEQATGLRIDGYASVGFAGFALLVDAVDGVDICVQDPIPAESVYPAIPAGCQTLDAPKALWYVRSRHSSAMQDLDRVQRQRAFMAALMKKLATPSTVINPVRYWDVNKNLSQAVELGNDTGFNQEAALLKGLREVSRGNGYAMSVPISDPDYDTPAGSAVLWDNTKADALFGQLQRGDTSNLDKYQR